MNIINAGYMVIIIIKYVKSIRHFGFEEVLFSPLHCVANVMRTGIDYLKTITQCFVLISHQKENCQMNRQYNTAKILQKYNTV